MDSGHAKHCKPAIHLTELRNWRINFSHNELLSLHGALLRLLVVEIRWLANGKCCLYWKTTRLNDFLIVIRPEKPAPFCKPILLSIFVGHFSVCLRCDIQTSFLALRSSIFQVFQFAWRLPASPASCDIFGIERERERDGPSHLLQGYFAAPTFASFSASSAREYSPSTLSWHLQFLGRHLHNHLVPPLHQRLLHHLIHLQIFNSGRGLSIPLTYSTSPPHQLPASFPQTPRSTDRKSALLTFDLPGSRQIDISFVQRPGDGPN